MRRKVVAGFLAITVGSALAGPTSFALSPTRGYVRSPHNSVEWDEEAYQKRQAEKALKRATPRLRSVPIPEMEQLRKKMGEVRILGAKP